MAIMDFLQSEDVNSLKYSFTHILCTHVHVYFTVADYVSINNCLFFVTCSSKNLKAAVLFVKGLNAYYQVRPHEAK